MRLTLCTLAALALLAPARADDDLKKTRYPTPPDSAGVKIVPDGWKAAPRQALAPAALDALVEAAQKPDKVTPAPLAPDDLFVRRVYLDLTGHLPGAKEILAFLSSTEPDKKAKLIDRLLAGDEFAKHQARFWRDVMLAKATNSQPPLRFAREAALEAWLIDQFKADRSWADIAKALITSESMLSPTKPREGGDAGLMLAHTMQDGPVERTNDVSRVFLGINISCAQCHDHPDDVWKRQQFHEMAAFMGKLGDRLRIDRETTPPTFEVSLVSRPFGDYRMPDQNNPRTSSSVSVRFLLDGTGPSRLSGDKDRRAMLAAKITDKDNYYFAAAFANRVWGQLLGQPFVAVDALGPLNPPLYGDVLLRLADSFRASGHDVKGLYRVILNSRAYQRQTRSGVSPTEHVKFGGSYPNRLNADAVYTAVTQVLGPVESGLLGRFRGFGGVVPPRLAGRGQSLATQFKDLFAFDPSTKAEDVEGSVPQSLLLMNNAQINAQMKASGNTPLARLLRDQSNDGKAVEGLYLHAMGRRPTANEKKVALDHVASAKSRGEAFEDLLWALINSAEFRTRREREGEAPAEPAGPHARHGLLAQQEPRPPASATHPLTGGEPCSSTTI